MLLYAASMSPASERKLAPLSTTTTRDERQSNGYVHQNGLLCIWDAPGRHALLVAEQQQKNNRGSRCVGVPHATQRAAVRVDNYPFPLVFILASTNDLSALLHGTANHRSQVMGSKP
jgi:hypothetical protein